MSPVEHKEGCWYPRMQADGKRYMEQWPNSCGRCDGWGGTGSTDEFGQLDFEPCPECLEKGKCPRCGGGVISEAYWDVDHFANCDNCGYIETMTSGYVYVEEPCTCPGMEPAWPYEVNWYLYDESTPEPEIEEPYPYEVSDHLYDAYRERGRF